jgi:hypothetical protein
MITTLHILSKMSCFVFVFNDKSTYYAYMLRFCVNWYMCFYGKGVLKSNTIIWDPSPTTIFNPYFSKNMH